MPAALAEMLYRLGRDIDPKKDRGRRNRRVLSRTAVGLVSPKSLQRFMYRVHGHIRGFNDLGNDAIGDVERPGLLPAWANAFDLKRRADQPAIAQDYFSCALPDGSDPGRSSPEFEGEGLGVAECHIFAPFPLKLFPARIPGIGWEPRQRNNDC
jgi:hypothetical protein